MGGKEKILYTNTHTQTYVHSTQHVSIMKKQEKQIHEPQGKNFKEEWWALESVQSVFESGEREKEE